MLIDKKYPGMVTIDAATYEITQDISSDNEIDIRLDATCVINGDLISKSHIVCYNGDLIVHGNVKSRYLHVNNGSLTVDGLISVERNINSEGMIRCLSDIESKEGEIEATQNIFCRGNLRTKKGGIKAGWDIRADKDIDCGARLVAGWGIHVGGSIYARTGIVATNEIRSGKEIVSDFDIVAGNAIMAGDYIYSGWSIDSGSNITAGSYIEAEKGIIATENISSGKHIDAGGGIIAGKGIKAKLDISSEKRIFAGVSTDDNSETCDDSIKCRKLIRGEIAYGKLIETLKEVYK